MFDRMPVLSIDKDGKWYADGVHMFRLEIVKLFSEHITKDDAGNYAIIWHDKTYPLEVEDVPFVISEVIVEDNKTKVRLTDSRIIDFNPPDVIFKNDIAYTTLFFQYDTRFSRKAQWQLHSYFVEKPNGIVLEFPSGKILVREI